MRVCVDIASGLNYFDNIAVCLASLHVMTFYVDVVDVDVDVDVCNSDDF